MDVSLNNYLKLSSDEAFGQIKRLMLEIERYGGTFISLWHNESLNDKGHWKGWKVVFTEMTKLAISLSNE